MQLDKFHCISNKKDFQFLETSFALTANGGIIRGRIIIVTARFIYNCIKRKRETC